MGRVVNKCDNRMENYAAYDASAYRFYVLKRKDHHALCLRIRAGVMFCLPMFLNKDIIHSHLPAQKRIKGKIFYTTLLNPRTNNPAWTSPCHLDSSLFSSDVLILQIHFPPFGLLSRDDYAGRKWQRGSGSK